MVNFGLNSASLLGFLDIIFTSLAALLSSVGILSSFVCFPEETRDSYEQTASLVLFALAKLSSRLGSSASGTEGDRILLDQCSQRRRSNLMKYWADAFLVVTVTWLYRFSMGVYSILWTPV
jgi:hypothetical protein